MQQVVLNSKYDINKYEANLIVPEKAVQHYKHLRRSRESPEIRRFSSGHSRSTGTGDYLIEMPSMSTAVS